MSKYSNICLSFDDSISSRVSFIEATIEDAEDLNKIYIKAFQDDLLFFGMLPANFGKVDYMKRIIRNNEYYKIMLDNKLVGGTWFKFLSNNIVDFKSTFLLPEVQNMGIGTITMKFKEGITKGNYIRMYTPMENDYNVKLYKKLGFKTVGIVKRNNVKFYEFFKDNRG